MDEHYAIEVLSGRKRGWLPAALRAGCCAASWAYAAAIRARNEGYDHGWLEVVSVDRPVISLGNLTAGGTGKTPLAALLAERLLSQGCRPGIVSRGYRSLNGQANDERLVLEQLLPSVPQVQHRDRAAGARSAIWDHGCDVIVLDDGFQHRRLHRDLDLVLIDATRPWGFGSLLPRGLLREPMSSLRRADVILLTRCDQVTIDELTEIRRELTRWRGTTDSVDVRFAPRRLRNANGEIRPLSLLQSEQCLSFCGIGNPEGFRRLLAGLQVDAPLRIFPDHHHYSAADLAELGTMAASSGASMIVTTQKDLVKIPHGALAGRPLWAVEIAAEIVSGEELLERELAKFRSPRRDAA